MANTYPYIEASQKGGRQRRPSAILVVPSWTTSETYAAIGIANRQHMPSAPHEASHFTVDETKIYQCVPLRTRAGNPHCSTKNLIRITLCLDPSEVQYGWDSPVHQDLLKQLASLIARLVVEEKINFRFLDYDGFRKWRKRPSRRKGGIFLQLETDPPLETLTRFAEEYRKDCDG